MQTLSTVKETKEKLHKKRNLFGLGLTSLIAACSGDAVTSAGVGGGGEVVETEEERIAREAREAETKRIADEKAAKEAIEKAAREAETKRIADEEAVKEAIEKAAREAIEKTERESEADKATALSSDAESASSAGANIYHLDDNDVGDLVISLPSFDGAYSDIGRIVIYWNTLTVPAAGDAPRTEIRGRSERDLIGIHAPDFLKLGGKDGYDMVIRSPHVNRLDSSFGDEGAIYILWDIADYKDNVPNAELDFAQPTAVKFPNGLLTIRGAKENDNIGRYEPEFLKIDGDDKYDMVIRSDKVDKSGDGLRHTDQGAIYILWDVSDYGNGNAPKDPKNVVLGSTAEHGLLSIYGKIKDDDIGTFAPDFLHLDDDAKYDMVIRSESVNDFSGAIYILWDVSDYGNNNALKKIVLGSNLRGEKAAHGSLAIYGASSDYYDRIGTYAPEFLKIGGEADSYDMVIRSHWVDNQKGAIYILWDIDQYANKGLKTVMLGNSSTDTGIQGTLAAGSLSIYGAIVDRIGSYEPEFLKIAGNDGYDMVMRKKDAIYILWDVEDYTGNKTIDLVTLDDIDFGLLTINGIGGAKNMQFIDINNDADQIKDIVFKDNNYYYVLFGEKVAEMKDGTVDSKTIDLAVVNRSLSNSAADFFGYNGIEGNVGYRFAEGGTKANLADVEGTFAAGLSGADADLGVWDIA